MTLILIILVCIILLFIFLDFLFKNKRENFFWLKDFNLGTINIKKANSNNPISANIDPNMTYPDTESSQCKYIKGDCGFGVRVWDIKCVDANGVPISRNSPNYDSLCPNPLVGDDGPIDIENNINDYNPLYCYKKCVIQSVTIELLFADTRSNRWSNDYVEFYFSDLVPDETYSNWQWMSLEQNKKCDDKNSNNKCYPYGSDFSYINSIGQEKTINLTNIFTFPIKGSSNVNLYSCEYTPDSKLSNNYKGKYLYIMYKDIHNKSFYSYIGKSWCVNKVIKKIDNKTKVLFDLKNNDKYYVYKTFQKNSPSGYYSIKNPTVNKYESNTSTYLNKNYPNDAKKFDVLTPLSYYNIIRIDLNS